MVLAFQTLRGVPHPPPEPSVADALPPGQASPRGDDRPGLRNPPFEWRVAVVGATLAVPGALAGLLACLFLGGPGDAAGALVAGGLLGTLVGMVLEASG